MKHLNFNQVHFVFYAFNSLPSTSFTNFISQKKKKEIKKARCHLQPAGLLLKAGTKGTLFPLNSFLRVR